jgi:hypothetical protein
MSSTSTAKLRIKEPTLNESISEITISLMPPTASIFEYSKLDKLVVTINSLIDGRPLSLSESVRVATNVRFYTDESELDAVLDHCLPGKADETSERNFHKNVVLLSQDTPFYIRSESDNKIVRMLDLHPNRLLNTLTKFIGQAATTISQSVFLSDRLSLFVEAMSNAVRLRSDISGRLTTRTALGKSTETVRALIDWDTTERDLSKSYTVGPFSLPIAITLAPKG